MSCRRFERWAVSSAPMVAFGHIFDGSVFCHVEVVTSNQPPDRTPRIVDLALARFVTRCRTSDSNPQPIPPIIALFSKTTEWHPSCYVLERLEKTGAAHLGEPSVQICFSSGEGGL